MSINYIGSGGLGQIGNLKTTPAVQNTKQNEGIENTAFSSVLEETKQIAGPGDTELAKRAEKVTALKEQIEAGTYKPDLQKVADSLANFLLDGE